ncbi:hypothetical protein ACJX0J_029550 [Zea mays]
MQHGLLKHLTDVVEYLQHMLDEFCSKEGAFFMFQNVFHPLVVEQKNLLTTSMNTHFSRNMFQFTFNLHTISRRTKENIIKFRWFFVTGIYIILQNSIIL